MNSGEPQGTRPWVREQVASAPPLTEEQIRQLERILGGVLRGLADSARSERSHRILRRTA